MKPRHSARPFSEFLAVLLKSVNERRGLEKPIALKEDSEVFHRAFYEIGKKYRSHFPEFNELHFITAGAYPYSPELTEALDLLQMSGAISRENPSFERFSPFPYHDTPEVLKKKRRQITAGDEKKERALDRLVRDVDNRLVQTT